MIDSTINLAWNEIRHRARIVKHLKRVPLVRGDSPRLGQVFLNLIVNAAQAIDEGNAEANEIRIATRQESDHVLVEIEDTGAGMSDAVRAHIFDPFFTTKPAGMGTGLGLAVCKGIVSALGGQIEAESEHGHGSCFRVRLPIASPESIPPLPIEPSEQTTRSGARILVIDDEPLLGHTLSLAFRDRHDIQFTTSGRQALAKLEHDTNFELILCDLMMPDISGMAVYEQVVAWHPELESRFAFMTGGAFSERARNFLLEHPLRTLEKPFVIDDVEALLEKMRKRQ